MPVDLPVINWFDKPIKQSISAVFEGLNDFVESLDLLQKYQNTHVEMLLPYVRTVKILGMQQPMDLARLYYPTNVSTDIRRRIYKPEWAKIDGSSAKPVTPIPKSNALGTKFVEANARTVVLGGPGAGKTTFLKYLALAYADQSVFGKAKLNRSYIPAYLHLPALPREYPNILHAIATPVADKTDERAFQFFERLLETGNLVVLLDSLDEVPIDAKQDIVKAIHEFCVKYPQARVIVSCRTADYQQVFDGFVEVEITRLTEEAVKSIVREWFLKEGVSEFLCVRRECLPTVLGKRI